MQEQNLKVTNPFVGAVPYQVEDWKKFRGRLSDLRHMIQFIKGNRVVILTSASACGKSSFIQASLIPTLVAYWNVDKEEYPIPFLFKDWAGGDGSKHAAEDGFPSDIAQIFGLQLFSSESKTGYPKAAAHFSPRIGLCTAPERQEMVQDVIGILKSNASRDVFPGLRAAAEGSPSPLLFIFDQFEELFRSQYEATGDILAFLKRLYSSHRSIRILISLREEYLHAILPLESMFDNLRNRTHTLEPLRMGDSSKRLESIQEVFRISLIESGFQIEETILKKLIENCSLKRPLRRNEAPSRSSLPNLLQTNVVFRELCDFCIGTINKKNLLRPLVITEELVNKFEKDTAKEYNYLDSENKLNKAAVYYCAIERWIEAKLKGEGQNYPYYRWVAARIAQHLVSSDFKIAISLESLVTRLFDPISRLGVEKHVGMNLGWALSGNIKFDDLKELVKDTISALSGKKSNVLKQFSQKGVVELVHDQVGPSFEQWARSQVLSWDDCVHSPVVKQGTAVQPINKPIDLPKKISLTFRGCVFKDERYNMEENPIPVIINDSDWSFKGITFHESIFCGTIFFNCAFKQCIFQSTDLSGVLFWACRFQDVQFENIDSEKSQIKFRGCVFNNVIMKNCKMVQSIFEKDPRNSLICQFTGEGLLLQDTYFFLSFFDEVIKSEPVNGEGIKASISENKHNVVFCCSLHPRTKELFEKANISCENLLEYNEVAHEVTTNS